MEEWGFLEGDEVELRGLSKIEMNGQRGTILPLESPEQARQLGRLAVMLHSGKRLSLKVENLLKVQVGPAAKTGGDLGEAWTAELNARGLTSSLPLFKQPATYLESSSRSGDLVVMTLNLQHLASFPRDPAVARRRLAEITGAPRPDLVCVQEGLEGVDLLAQVGYVKLVSSAVKAQTLREMLYDDESALAAVPAVAHESLMVNELYMRSEDCAWEVEGTGVEQISSEGCTVSQGDGAAVLLATRSIVWARLRPRSSAEGPFVFVMNTQLSGCRIEDELFLSQLADERRRQAARAVDIFASRAGEDDLGILVGDFGAVSGPMASDCPEAGEAPIEALGDIGWSFAYGKEVGPTCLFGYVADHMATNHQVAPRSVQCLSTANVIGEAEVEVPLSDHNAVKVAFPVLKLAASAVGPGTEAENSGVLEELPAVGFGGQFLPEDLAERVPDQDFHCRVDELTQSAIKAALSSGVRLFESANRHINQQSVGQALETAFSDGVLKRSEIFLCGRISKCKDRQQVQTEVEMMLRELRVDYVDLLTTDIPPEQVPQAWPWLEEVLKEGRARHLGVANFDLLGPKVCVDVFRSFLSGVKIPPSVLAMEVHPLNTNEEMSECCHALGIQVMAYSPIGAPHKLETFMKVMTKSDARELRLLLKVPELQILQSIARRHEVSPVQVALRWNLQRGHCIVPKSFNPEHIVENSKLFHFCLSTEEMATISKLHKGVRTERFFQASFSGGSKALPRMTRDAQDECQRILNKLRGPGGAVPKGAAPHGFDGPRALPQEVAQKGGHDPGGKGKVDWEKLGFQRPVEEEPGFWRRMGLALGKGPDGKGKGKGPGFPELKNGLPLGGKGVPPPAMVGYRDS